MRPHQGGPAFFFETIVAALALVQSQSACSVFVTSLMLVRRRLLGDGERLRHLLPRNWLVIGVNQSERHLVRTGGKVGDVNRVGVACIRPPPRQVVDDDVQVPDAGRYLGSTFPEHGNDTQVLHAVLGPVDAQRQSLWNWRVHNQLGCGLVFDVDVR